MWSRLERLLSLLQRELPGDEVLGADRPRLNHLDLA
jgi:hypothetical protein